MFRHALVMWQEILAVDSRASRLRPMAMATATGGAELRPMYLKRRLQLLQQQGRGRGAHNSTEFDECQMQVGEPLGDPDIVDREAGGGERRRVQRCPALSPCL